MKKIYPLVSLYFRPKKNTKCEYCEKKYKLAANYYIANCCRDCWDAILDE